VPNLCIDILASLYNYQLSRNVGAEGLVILTILVQTSAGLREWNDALGASPIMLIVRSPSHHPSLRRLCRS
jgi:hypothetical protein